MNNTEETVHGTWLCPNCGKGCPSGTVCCTLVEVKPRIPGVDVKHMTTELTERDFYYNELNERGVVCKFKMESGVRIKVAELGSIKDFFNRALERAALLTQEQYEEVDMSSIPHIEAAAMRMAAAAGAGCLKSTVELMDRILGKAKLISESTTLSLTIDDILNGVQKKGEVVENTQD